MKNYIPTQTTNLQIECCVSFVVDGIEIAIFEDYIESQFDIISSWANEIKYKPLFKFKIEAYCDYAEFYIEQTNWETMIITSQFYDGTDRISGFCDAKTVYQKTIDFIEHYFIK